MSVSLGLFFLLGKVSSRLVSFLANIAFSVLLNSEQTLTVMFYCTIHKVIGSMTSHSRNPTEGKQRTTGQMTACYL